MTRLARSPAQLGNTLREARRSKRLTQQALAELSGLRQETISRLENGAEGARLETLFQVFAALDLELLVAPRSQGNTDFLEDSL